VSQRARSSQLEQRWVERAMKPVPSEMIEEGD
jgi:hypothetical protein